MTHIQLDYGKTLEFLVNMNLINKRYCKTIHKTIHEGTGVEATF